MEIRKEARRGFWTSWQKGNCERCEGQERECTYIYIGPRSGDNDATPSIQRMTRGDSIGKCNRRNSVSEMSHATQKLTRGISFGRRDEHRRLTNDFTTRGSQRPM